MIGEISTIGFVVGSGRKGILLPLLIGEVSTQDPLGFTYFQISINANANTGTALYDHDDNNKVHQHHSVVQYGHLLPHLATLELNNNEHIPYAVVTTEGDAFDATFPFAEVTILCDLSLCILSQI